MKVMETFDVDVNQGMRDAQCVAVIGDEYLYEYEMPAGTSALRIGRDNQSTFRDRNVAYATIPFKWLLALEDQYGIDQLLARPQKHGRASGEQVRKELKARLLTFWLRRAETRSLLGLTVS
jgi:hypothetical protein